MSGVVSEGVPAGCQPAGSSSYACAVASETSTFDDICRSPICGKAAPAKSVPPVGDATSKLHCAPSSPSMGPGANFFRMISGCSTEPPETMLEHFDEDEDVLEAYDERPLPPLISEERPAVEVLEDKLSELKELFLAKYGHDVDSDDFDEERAADQEETRDQDGMVWIKTVGTGLCTYDTLEGQLAEVKGLYAQRFGSDVDEEDSEDDDEVQRDAEGMLWIKTISTGPCTYDTLEDQLAEVKGLYAQRFGRDVDEEDSEDEDEVQRDAEGTLWIKTIGTGPCTYESLEDQLADVKALYAKKFGGEVDEESEDEEFQRDAEGTLWIKTVGTGPCTFESLEDQLSDVKALYAQRFGRDVDEESEDDEQLQRDADGTLWIKTVGTGPCSFDSLEDQLAEVKGLYAQRFGRDVDEDSEDGEDFQRDAEGTLWTKTIGTGPCTLESLESKLAEVKDLYAQRFGIDVDEDEGEPQRDDEGTLWIKTVGTGPCNFESLEDQLSDVKALYAQRFGRDVDEESEDDEQLQRDADGTLWIKTVGTGPCSFDSLEDQLAEVKGLYAQRFGRDVDEESEDDELQRDAEGTLWIKTVGTGPCTVESLEDQLSEVKALYRERFGVDADEESEDDELQRDAEGTLWIKTVGTGPCTVESLEDQLSEVKALYAQRFGRDLDEESEGEEQLQCDADGTLWVKTVGTGPCSYDSLEDKLAEVKDLYCQRFGRDLDEDSEGGTELQYDADGTLWIKTVGAGPCTYDSLEDKLAEVKALYAQRFGQDPDDEAEDSEAEDLERDADGTLWIKTVGAGPCTFDSLEGKLAEVKALYARRFGADTDEDSDVDEELELDADGTLWIKTVGNGLLLGGSVVGAGTQQ